jgi:hypothetical protein
VWAKCGGKVQRDLRGNGEFSGKLAMINWWEFFLAPERRYE